VRGRACRPRGGRAHRVREGELLRQQQRDPAERVELRVDLRDARYRIKWVGMALHSPFPTYPTLSSTLLSGRSRPRAAGRTHHNSALQLSPPAPSCSTLQHAAPACHHGTARRAPPDTAFALLRAGRRAPTGGRVCGQVGAHAGGATPCSPPPGAPTAAGRRAAAARLAALESPECPPRCCPAASARTRSSGAARQGLHTAPGGAVSSRISVKQVFGPLLLPHRFTP